VAVRRVESFTKVTQRDCVNGNALNSHVICQQIDTKEKSDEGNLTPRKVIVNKKVEYKLLFQHQNQKQNTNNRIQENATISLQKSATTRSVVKPVDVHVTRPVDVYVATPVDVHVTKPVTVRDVYFSAVNCSKLLSGDRYEQKRAADFQKLNKKVQIPDSTYADIDCERFIKENDYVMSAVSEEEKDFPLAFSILIFKDIEQFERLLRAIYRPQNYYCVHVDSKSTKTVHRAAEKLSSCFQNVFIASRSYNVEWGTISIVQPELTCMHDLMKYKKWKYFINLTGQEFPLQTNWQIVRILKIFNGANNLEGTVARRNVDRVNALRPVPPVNITLTKGSVHITASRDFIHYILYDNNSLLFLDWVKDTYVPDETYFSSLNYSPQLDVPGSYLGIPETDTDKNLFITRFKNWGDGPFNWPCYGRRVRQVCIFGVKDLPLLSSRPELFANKFYLDFEPLTFDCMEERLHARVHSEVTSHQSYINTAFYSELDFVQHHL